MSRFAEVQKRKRKEGLASKKDELQTLFEIGQKYMAKQMEEFIGNFDMEAELDKSHLLGETAMKVYPNDKKVFVASYLCNIGRGNEYKITGGFNGKGEFDYRKIGVAVLDKLWIQHGGDMLSCNYQQIRNAVEFHGETAVPEWAAAVDMDIINSVSVVDSIVQGGTAWVVLYRQQQTHAKSVEKGGFIPKENQWSKEISPSCFKNFKKGKIFNVNECKTYADYSLYFATMIMHNLKSKDLKIAKAQIELLDHSAESFVYLNSEGKPLKNGEAFYKRDKKGQFVMANKEGEF